MEAHATSYESPLTERVTRVEIKVEGVQEDIRQINERLDRAARAAYFLGSSFLALAGVIAGSFVAG